jgi:regulator of sirC expression with transglutaminase-like and TPR domain
VSELGSTTQSAPFSEGQFTALLKLLGDDDPQIYETIRAKLLSVGESVYDRLENHRLHPDPAVRRRVLELLNQRDRAVFDGEFLSFVLNHGERFDLEDAVWKFVKTTYPRLNIPAYQAQLDEWADRIRERLRRPAIAEVCLTAMNMVLFDELNLRGNTQDYYNVANSYLNQVMDRRLGIPITLSLVYLFVARRLALPMVGIGMPNHFLCRYQNPREELYVDAFNRGEFLTRVDCKRKIANYPIEYDESYLAPMANRRILQRLIANLLLVHKERNDRAEVERLQRYLVALSR